LIITVSGEGLPWNWMLLLTGKGYIYRGGGDPLGPAPGEVTAHHGRRHLGPAPRREVAPGVAYDGNKSLYLVFVGRVVFSQHLGLLLGQQDSSILTVFRTAGQHLDCF
jgi:hypothetical protein